MVESKLSVRELEEKDIPLLANYWFNATPQQLNAMGADIEKLPPREMFEARLKMQALLPYPEKEAYILIWEVDGQPIGHSNLNPAKFGEHGYMHLHMWYSAIRQKGLGTELVRMSIPYFFKNMDLQTLYCEPYALNPTPHKVLEKTGFKFVKEYVTTPGSITFEQPVKLWQMDRP